ncbi:ABC transporter permease [Myroides sp. LJL119]
MFLYFRLLSSSFYFAINALRTNKLRTVLSLLGVTVGIFSIIAVLAAVDSLEKNIKKELNNFDANMIYLFNGSFGPTDVPRWKREQFPQVNFEEYEYLKKHVQGVEYISYDLFTKRENIMYNGFYANDVSISAGGVDMQYLDNLRIADGRFFNETESNSGGFVVVLGHEVANTLFNFSDPIGKRVRLYGKNFTVVGVLEKQGDSSINIGGKNDEKAIVPSNTLRVLYGDNSNMITPVIVIKPYNSYNIDNFQEELRVKLRAFRGLKVGDDDNFFINQFGGLMDFIDSIISQMNTVGWIVSGFSLLVGGFGIANIMFVSVKERTHLIGVQKAIGAKNHFILVQFLFEAIILALIGGGIGVILVWIIAAVVSGLTSFIYVLSLTNVFIGLIISGVIGILSGYLPAKSAAKLDPVEAIRSGM